MSKLTGRLYPVLLGLILCSLYASQFFFKAYVEIDLETYLEYRAPVQVYWASEGRNFSEDNVETHSIFHKHNVLKMRVGDLSGEAKLRIDPIQYQGHAKIKSVRIRQSGYQAIELVSKSQLEQLQPVNHIASAVFEDQGLVITTSGHDSQLVLDMELQKLPGFTWHHLLNLTLIMAASLLIAPWVFASFERLTYVPVCLLVALVLALAMSVLSKPNVHPDEITHVKSIKYYNQHNLPPRVDGPEIADTYSFYGNSRLNGYEIYYFLAGYFSRLAEPLDKPLVVIGRSLSIIMLLALLLLAIRYQSFRVVVTPLVITPQAWYMFSYANSDIYSLFASVIATWMAVDPESPLNRFLSEKRPSRFWLKAATLGLFTGSLLFLKINYYVYILFIGLYFLWRVWRGDFSDKSLLLKRSMILLLIGLCFFGSRILWDGVNNNWDRGDRIHQMWEKYANELYKPSTPLANKHPEMYLRERGNSLDDMLRIYRWDGKSFLSSFGGYGFTEFFASPHFYDWVRIIGLSILSLMLFSVLVRGSSDTQVLFMLSMVLGLMILAVSFYASWVRVLQPQGRYLAPILPILGVLYYHLRPCLYQWVFHCLILAMFLLSVYSFIFIGLAEIPKI